MMARITPNTSVRPPDAGVALVVVLLATVLLTALGVGLVTLSDADRVVAFGHEGYHATGHAADAVAELVVHELAQVADWTDTLNGSAQSSFRDVTVTPRIPARGVTDLLAFTTALQREMDAGSDWGADNPVWQLLAFGWLGDVISAPGIARRDYIVVWAADDSAETDGDPRRDHNGVIWLLVRSMGQSGATQTRRVVLERARFVQDPEVEDPAPAQFRTGPGSVRVLSWRAVP
jgi:hypothetical protein